MSSSTRTFQGNETSFIRKVIKFEIILTEFKVGAGLVGACERASYHEMRNRIKSLFLFIKVIVAAWKRKLLVEVAEV